LSGHQSWSLGSTSPIDHAASRQAGGPVTAVGVVPLFVVAAISEAGPFSRLQHYLM
jgi:hypothetical protein